MHELGIAREIINIATHYLPENSKPVKAVKVKIGKLSNVLIDTLIFNYDALIHDTPLENSKLLVDEIPVTIKCSCCSATNTVDDFIFLCPECGSGSIEVTGGSELQVEEIELEN